MEQLSTVVEREATHSMQVMPHSERMKSAGPTGAARDRADRQAAVASHLTPWIERIEAARAAVAERRASPSFQMLTEDKCGSSALPAGTTGYQAEQLAAVESHLAEWIERIEVARAALRNNSLSLFAPHREVKKGLATVSTSPKGSRGA